MRCGSKLKSPRFTHEICTVGLHYIFSSLEAFFLFILVKGVYSGQIAVIFGHMVYGYALFATHPLWYIFGVMEWVALSCLNGFTLFLVWKRG